MRPSQQTINRSRNLRQDATNAERLAWKLLRNRTALGIKFRRQHPIGKYIVDFYCPERASQSSWTGACIRSRASCEETRAKRDSCGSKAFSGPAHFKWLGAGRPGGICEEGAGEPTLTRPATRDTLSLKGRGLEWMGKVLRERHHRLLFLDYALSSVGERPVGRAGIKALDFPSPRRGEGAPRSGAGEGWLRHGGSRALTKAPIYARLLDIYGRRASGICGRRVRDHRRPAE